MKLTITAVLFLIIGMLLAPAGAWIYLNHGHPPVAVADPSFPMEAQIVRKPLNRRIDQELPANDPVAVNDITLTEGANVYVKQCAFCHGLPGKPSNLSKAMYPGVPQLWQRHRNGPVVGVSDDPAGATYWRVKNGIRLTGMPSYRDLLTDKEMWEVSNLLHAADQPMPAPVQAILAQGAD